MTLFMRKKGGLTCDGSNERQYREYLRGQVDLYSDCTVGSKVCGNLHLVFAILSGSFSVLLSGFIDIYRPLATMGRTSKGQKRRGYSAEEENRACKFCLREAGSAIRRTSRLSCH